MESNNGQITLLNFLTFIFKFPKWFSTIKWLAKWTRCITISPAYFEWKSYDLKSSDQNFFACLDEFPNKVGVFTGKFSPG